MNNLYVYYGWSKVNKIAKREALSVIFINENTGPRIGKDGQDGVTRFMHVCFRRKQTDGEAAEGARQNRIYTRYDIYMDDKDINGSLKMALEENSRSDRNNVSEKVRKVIEKKLQEGYFLLHPEYREPLAVQQTFNFTD